MPRKYIPTNALNAEKHAWPQDCDIGVTYFNCLRFNSSYLTVNGIIVTYDRQQD